MPDDAQGPERWTPVLRFGDQPRLWPELTILATALPASVARQSLDRDDRPAGNGRPARIYCRSEGDATVEDWLVVWRVQRADAGAFDEVYGLVRRAADGTRLRLLKSHVFGNRPLPEDLRPDGRWLGSDAIPWEGPVDDLGVAPPVRTAGELNPRHSAPSGGETASLDEQVRAAREAATTIERDHAIVGWQLPDALRWWRHGVLLGPDELGRLHACLARGSLRFGLLESPLDEWRNARATRYALPFYRGYSLFVVDGLPSKPGSTAFLVVPTGFDDAPTCVLGTESAPIHRFNALVAARGELALDADTSAAYLFFFCRFVRGDEGPFWLVEGPDDLVWTDDAPDLERIRAVVDDELRPIRQLAPIGPPATPDPAGFKYAAFVNFGVPLFYARLKVDPSGNTAMEDDAPAFTDLPIRPRRDTEVVASAFDAVDVLDRFVIPAGGAAADHRPTGPLKLVEPDGPRRERIESFLTRRRVVNFVFPDAIPGQARRPVIVRIAALPFYDGCSLIQITDRPGLHAQSCFAIADLDGDPDAPACFLGRSADDLRTFTASLLERSRLRIDAATVAAYVEFVHRPYVQAGAYRYAIVQAADDLRWSFGPGVAGAKAFVERVVEPPRLLAALVPGERATDGFDVAAFVCQRRDFGYRRLRVGTDGTIVDEAGAVLRPDLPIVPVIWDVRSQFVLRSATDGGER